MFYFLSKTAYYILMPYTWVFVLLCCAIFSKNAQHKKRAIIISLSLLFFFSNPFLINLMMLQWEPAPVAFEKLEKYDYAVVLTGVTIQKKPYDRVFFHKGADRATQTLQLYKKGLVSKILITGGKPGIIDYGVAESEILKDFFVMAGVPATNVITEVKAKNTYENAKFTAEILNKIAFGKKVLLVTSAFHMNRSVACFKKAGLNFDIFPVDYYTHDPVWSDVFEFPNTYPFQLWSILIHEWIGLVAYKVTGKI
jgi:uncharacterized SAM-binding protein YcdF (DUF218 family)